MTETQRRAAAELRRRTRWQREHRIATGRFQQAIGEALRIPQFVAWLARRL